MSATQSKAKCAHASTCVSKNEAPWDSECFCCPAQVDVHAHGTENTRLPFQNMLMCWRYLVRFPLVERGYVVSEIGSVVDPSLMPALDSY